jgi:hypothetical protein
MAIVIDTPQGIEFYRLNAFKQALKLEVVHGMRSRHNPAALLRREFGWTGNKARILALLEDRIAEKFGGI